MSVIEPTPVKSLRLISLLKQEQLNHDMQRSLELLQEDKCDISSVTREDGLHTSVELVNCKTLADLQRELQVLPDAMPNLLLLSISLLGSDVANA
ncbi:MAG: hypothetical protein HKO07_08845, partial [Pseudomonadales bacterium]|nr:hypothetical protein [Pseudomonadales bacterium]